jgi:hypothetical protein
MADVTKDELNDKEEKCHGQHDQQFLGLTQAQTTEKYCELSWVNTY